MNRSWARSLALGSNRIAALRSATGEPVLNSTNRVSRESGGGKPARGRADALRSLRLARQSAVWRRFDGRMALGCCLSFLRAVWLERLAPRRQKSGCRLKLAASRKSVKRRKPCRSGVRREETPAARALRIFFSPRGLLFVFGCVEYVAFRLTGPWPNGRGLGGKKRAFRKIFRFFFAGA